MRADHCVPYGRIMTPPVNRHDDLDNRDDKQYLADNQRPADNQHLADNQHPAHNQHLDGQQQRVLAALLAMQGQSWEQA